MSTFTGFPAAAIDFYEDLEANNERAWWLANKQIYDDAVRAPLDALLAELGPRFGETTKVFRPNRDVRFSKDKSPYKTAQGGYVATAAGFAYYAQIGAAGLMLGGGGYTLSPDQLARFREAVSQDRPGTALAKVTAGLRHKGFELGGEQLKTMPRGFDKEHPRADLLKYKSLYAGVQLGEPDWLSTPKALTEIRRRWEAVRPLVDWLGEYVGRADL